MTNHFDTAAQDWDKNQLHLLRTEAIAQLLQKKIKLNTKMRALEFGSGTGLLSFALQSQLADITLMDSSVEMTNTTLTKVENAQLPHLHPIFFDLEQEDYQDATFDIIFSQMALHHVGDIDKIIKKFAALLPKGGHLAIADLYKEDGSFHDMEFHGHFGFHPDELAAILHKHNFTHVSHSECFVIEKITPEGPKSYPVFLLTASK